MTAPTLQVQIIPVTPYMQNCSVLYCTKSKLAAVVDPGGDLEKITAFLEENDLTLEKIFITHGHLDHAGGTAKLAKQFNIPVLGPHRDDQFLTDSIPQQGAQAGFHGDSFTPDTWLKHGDTVQFSDIEFDVIHCPGHTPGHVVFHNKVNKLAIVGDVIFQGSIGRTDFPRGNTEDLLSSIRDRLFTLGDDIQFIPGHGPMSNFGTERQTNPFVADHRFG